MNYNKLIKAIELFKEWLEEQNETLEDVENGREPVVEQGSSQDESNDYNLEDDREDIVIPEPDYSDSDIWAHTGAGNASVVEHPSESVEPTNLGVVENKEVEANADTFCDKDVAPTSPESISIDSEGSFQELSQAELSKMDFKELHDYYRRQAKKVK